MIPKISIIMPFYNVESYLGECLESILNQSLIDFEIIAINDKSTDNSMNIIHENISHDNRIKIIQNKKNYGVSISRNIGLKHAKGEYIFFIDSDDIIKPGSLEKMYLCATDNESEIVLLNGEKFYENGNTERFNNPFYGNNPNTYVGSCAWFCLFKLSFLRNNTDIQFTPKAHPHEDAAFTFKAFSYVKKISKINEPIILYRQHKRQNTSLIFSNQKRKDLITSTKLVFEDLNLFMKKNNFNKERYLALNDQKIIMISYLGLSFFEIYKKEIFIFYIKNIFPLSIMCFIYRKKITRSNKKLIKIFKIPIYYKKIV